MEGAGVHHNPTPTNASHRCPPADGEWLYGHRPPLGGGARVALAWLATHPTWGLIAWPLRSLLYVHELDVPQLADKYDWEFRTKHQYILETVPARLAIVEQFYDLTGAWGEGQ